MKTPLLVVFLLAAPAFADDAPADIWKAKCKSCHGDDGKGKTKQGEKYKAPDMSTAEWNDKKPDAEIKKAIAEGVPKTKMEGFKDKLSPTEIDSLVKYIRGLKK